MKHTKNCLGCKVELVNNLEDDNYNWTPSRVEKKDYRCNKCYSLRENLRIKNRKLLQTIKADYKESFDKIPYGDVYIISNPAWKGWYKIGMATNAKDRLMNYQTSSPMRDYKLEYKKTFNDKRKAELKAQALCAKEATDTNGEWFKIPVTKAIKLIKTITEVKHEEQTA